MSSEVENFGEGREGEVIVGREVESHSGLRQSAKKARSAIEKLSFECVLEGFSIDVSIAVELRSIA